MSTVKTVSVHYGRKLNLGDFNSATVEVTFWADVEPDADLDAEMRALHEMAKANVKAQLLPLTNKGSMKAEEIYLGLPVALQEIVNGNGHEDDWTHEGDTDPNSGMPYGDK